MSKKHGNKIMHMNNNARFTMRNTATDLKFKKEEKVLMVLGLVVLNKMENTNISLFLEV